MSLDPGEAASYMHKNNYLETHNSIIQWIISQESWCCLQAFLHHCTMNYSISI